MRLSAFVLLAFLAVGCGDGADQPCYVISEAIAQCGEPYLCDAGECRDCDGWCSYCAECRPDGTEPVDGTCWYSGALLKCGEACPENSC